MIEITEEERNMRIECVAEYVYKLHAKQSGETEIGFALLDDSKKDGFRLVANAFVAPNYDTNLQVNHIDSDKKNNRADNLEWVTGSENISRHYHEGKRSVSGKRKTAMTDADLARIRELYATGNYTYKQIGAMYDVRLETISNVVNRLVCYKNR